MVNDEERSRELSRFLKERRARLQPEDAGLPPTPRRRVPGLRREEVAALAGIGVSWYTSLENGDARGVSENTLQGVASALRLSDSERDYFFALAGCEEIEPFRAPSHWLISAMHAERFPAYIINAEW